MHLTPKGAVEFSSENPVSRFQKKEKFNGKHEAFERTRWLEMCFVDGGNKVTIAAEEGGHPGTWVKYRDTLLDGGILLFCKIVTFPDGITRVSRTTRAIGGLAKNQQLPKNTKKRFAAHLRKTRRYRSTHMLVALAAPPGLPRCATVK